MDQELTRFVVLVTSVLDELLTEAKRAKLEPVLREMDALTMVLARRSRSHIDYHLSSRGRAALADAQIVAPELRGGATQIEWETRRWSQEQVSGGPLKPGDEPMEIVEHRLNLKGAALLSSLEEE